MPFFGVTFCTLSVVELLNIALSPGSDRQRESWLNIGISQCPMLPALEVYRIAHLYGGSGCLKQHTSAHCSVLNSFTTWMPVILRLVVLHEFVTANRDEIIRRCRGKVAPRLVPPPTQDECNGLPSSKVGELFRPFEQRGADRTGAGLGLAFSRWGADENNGRIYARNRPQLGCCLRLDLPRVTEPQSY